jgi:hypothetical protein
MEYVSYSLCVFHPQQERRWHRSICDKTYSQVDLRDRGLAGILGKRNGNIRKKHEKVKRVMHLTLREGMSIFK